MAKYVLHVTTNLVYRVILGTIARVVYQIISGTELIVASFYLKNILRLIFPYI